MNKPEVHCRDCGYFDPLCLEHPVIFLLTGERCGYCVRKREFIGPGFQACGKFNPLKPIDPMSYGREDSMEGGNL